MKGSYLNQCVIKLTAILIFACLCFNVTHAHASTLPIDEAFALRLMKNSDDTVLLQGRIAPGYQIYRDSIQFDEATIDSWPKSTLFTDSLKNEKQVYTNQLDLIAKLKNPHGTVIHFSFQGCHGQLQCYPPQYLSFNLQKSGQWVAPEAGQSSQQHADITFSLVGFFLAGLLLSFTPCVLPMLPVLAAMLFGQHALTPSKKMRIALIYTLSMAFSYAFAGLLAAWLGYGIQGLLQHPIIIGLYAIALFIMGIFMWIDAPPKWLSGSTFSCFRSQKWATPALLGATTLLIASPCITPALIGVLAYISTTGNFVLGGLGLWLLGLGMGTPLLCVALLGSQALPKSGNWMNQVKKLGSLLLIGMALWLGVRALDLHEPVTKTDTLDGVHLIQLHQLDDLHAAIQKAQDAQVSLIFFYTAHWCATCHTLENKIFNNKQSLRKLSPAHIYRIDISQHTSSTQKMMQAFHVIAPPTIVILKPDFTQATLVGPVSLKQLQKILTP